jgi:hypothetical protein
MMALDSLWEELRMGGFAAYGRHAEDALVAAGSMIDLKRE